VADVEEEAEVGAEDYEHGADVEQGGEVSGEVDGQEEPAEDEEGVPSVLH